MDEVHGSMPYTPSFDVLSSLNCGFYAHGDDPCIDHEGVDICKRFADKGMFKLFKRTEGVSTTDITTRLLGLAEKLLMETNPEEEQ